MSRLPIPTWFFVLVVVRRGEQFLLVHERKHGQLWYLPAGRVEPGETFVEAAVRETAAAHAQALAHAQDRLAVVLWDSPVGAALALRDVVVFAGVSPVAAALAEQLVARFAGWGVVVEIATGTVALGVRP